MLVIIQKNIILALLMAINRAINLKPVYSHTLSLENTIIIIIIIVIFMYVET
jgi:hypothetical protein